jgi:hypothetical protein
VIAADIPQRVQIYVRMQVVCQDPKRFRHNDLNRLVRRLQLPLSGTELLSRCGLATRLPLASRFFTVVGCHAPPRAVGTFISFKRSAIAASV